MKKHSIYRERMLTMSNKTGKGEHEGGQRLAVALGLAHGCV